MKYRGPKSYLGQFGCTLVVVMGMHRHGVIKDLSLPKSSFPAEVKQGDTLLSYFSCHSVNTCPSRGLFGATFSISL